jgi:hypothetical protein
VGLQLGFYLEVCGDERFNHPCRNDIYKDDKMPVNFAQVYKEGDMLKRSPNTQIREIHGKRFEIIEVLVSNGVDASNEQ